ncbi:MAG TPA: TonB-dependent receptor, partial [Rhodanobacteraceae bacterium]|nr:TonB-dependent receptor [Rhodanobacteraceae bacterium]
MALRRSLLAASLALIAAGAAANDTPPAAAIQAVPLHAVSVQASVADTAPVSGVEVHVDRRQLDHHNTVEVEDILAFLPNLSIRKRYIGDANAILGGRAAGTTQSARSLVYADGLLLSDLLDSGYANPPRWGMLALQDIASIDVLYGPFSALYPGNSMGTTVIFHTRLPEHFEASADTQGFVQSFGDAYGHRRSLDGRRISAALGDRAGCWRWALGVSRLDNHGQPMQYASARPGGDAAAAVPVAGAAPDRNPDGSARLLAGPTGMDHTRQDHARLQIGLDLGAHTQARFTAGYWRNRSDVHGESRLRDAAGRIVDAGPIRVGDTVWTVPASAFAPSAARENHRLLGLELSGRLVDAWHWNAVASRYDLLQSRTTEAAQAVGGSGSIADNAGSGWHTLDLRASGPLGSDHTLYLGAHADRYVLASSVQAASDWRGAADGARTAAFGGRTQTLALYAQDEWTVTPAWTFTLGARLEQWRARDGSRATEGPSLPYPSRQRTATSPKAALAWAFADDWQVRLSLGKAVRFPTVGELFQGSVSANAIVGNDPDLEPERDWARDLTLQHRLGNGHWRVSVFDDAIGDSLYKQTDITVTPSVTRVQNIDRVRIRGIEAAFVLRDLWTPGFDLSGSIAFNGSRTVHDRQYPLADGKDFPRIPRERAALTADWRFADAWQASVSVRRSGRQFGSLDNSDTLDTFGALSAFTMADAQLRWRFAPRWQASLGVDNLTGRRAWVYHPWPGRTWFAGLHWS